MDYTEEIREGLLNLEEGSDFHITRNGGRIELTKEELFKAYEYQQNIFYHDMITEYVKSEAPEYKLLPLLPLRERTEMLPKRQSDHCPRRPVLSLK